MTTVDTAELRRLLAAATPGPWEQTHGVVRVAPDGDPIAGLYGTEERRKDDAALLVAAVNALPVLLDRLDTYREVYEAAKDPALMDIADDKAMYAAHKRLAAALARVALDTEQT